MRRRFCILFLFPLVILSCGRAGDTSRSEKPSEAEPVVSLALPGVPARIQDSRERIRYLLEHYWDKMDWRDTELINNDGFMEQTMANYFGVLAKADSLVGAGALNRMIASASINPVALQKIVALSDKYLYEPESPMYDSEGYAMLLDQLLLDPAGSGVPIDVIRHRHSQIMKNRVGHKASRFDFISRTGQRLTFSPSAANGVETLLMFYDPDCNVCQEAGRMLGTSERLNSLIVQGRLRIVAVYPAGTELTKWKAHADSLPRNWTVGYSPGGVIDEEEIYVVRATPAIYLIDANGIVREKDISARDLLLRR